MVRHGKDKKRRSGRVGRVKLKNRTWTRWDPKPKVTAALKEHWDPSKSPSANLEQLGLLAKPNQLTLRRSGEVENDVSKDGSKKSLVELFDIPESDKPSRRSQFPLTEEEEQYMAKCMTKWGDNYTAMFRDLTVNNMQHTLEKLRKMGSRYLLLGPEQRRVPVPDRIRALIPSSS